MDFKDFLGNDKNIALIKKLLISQTFPHTFLLEGVNGCGKFALAEIIAKFLVCGDDIYKFKYGDGCGKCGSCRKAEQGVHSDIVYLDIDKNKPSAENNESKKEKAKSIYIDDIREALENISFYPNDSDKKVYIIRNAENLTVQAQNALLKSLEEPPPFAHFILTVKRRDLLLETIVSRSVIMTLDLPDEQQITQYFSEHGKTADSDDLSKAIRLSGGSIGETERILNGSSFFEKNKHIFNAYIKSLADNSAENVLKLIYNHEFNREELLLFYSHLEIMIRDIGILSVYDSGVPENKLFFYRAADIENQESTVPLRNILNNVSRKKIINVYKKILKYKAELDFNVNARLNLINFLI